MILICWNMLSQNHWAISGETGVQWCKKWTDKTWAPSVRRCGLKLSLPRKAAQSEWHASVCLWSCGSVPHEGSAILLKVRLDKRFLVLQRLMFDIPTLDICSYEWGAAKVLLGFLVNMSESFCIHGAQALELQTKEASFETGLAH